MVFLNRFAMVLLGSLLLVSCATPSVSRDTRQTTGFWQEFHRHVADNGGPDRSGKEVYEFRCRGCHGKNTQGAPMPGDRMEWQSRLAKGGMERLLEHAIQGYGELMPPRGGCRNCRDGELLAAIQYMIELPELSFEAVKPPS